MREYFLDRIYGEYQAYKASVLEENGGSVYARCYEIDCMINIYEILKEFAMKLPANELERLIIPQLADISSLTNDLLECDTLPSDQRDIVNLIQKGVLELWQSLSK